LTQKQTKGILAPLNIMNPQFFSPAASAYYYYSYHNLVADGGV
jgi:hypothetical protein